MSRRDGATSSKALKRLPDPRDPALARLHAAGPRPRVGPGGAAAVCRQTAGPSCWVPVWGTWDPVPRVWDPVPVSPTPNPHPLGGGGAETRVEIYGIDSRLGGSGGVG